MKSSIASRSVKLLGLAAKVTKTEIALNLREQFVRGVDEIASGRIKSRIEQAKLITENLSHLKGAAMKAGQLLSLDAAEYFPPEAVEILSQLQGKAEPVDWALVREVIEEDLGQSRIDEFEKLSIVPVASASIGQVHKGRLKGQDVAVKIQYRGITDSIDSDLKILRTLAQGMLTVSGKRIELNELFEELKVVLHQEADYNLEREHMKEYRRLLAKHESFLVPEPIDSHSSRRVLTMTWQDGLNLNDWLKTNPSVETREAVARALLDLYCMEFYEWGLVQTDPNYGNFLIQPEKPKLVVLDFGATLRYTPEFRRQYIELVKLMSTFEGEKIVQAFLDMGLLSPKESAESRELLVDMLLVSLEPFQPAKQPFRFKDDDYSKRMRTATQRFTQSLKHSPPPRQILFLHRKLGGIFSFLKKLEIEVDITPYWTRMTQAKIEG